MTFRIGPFPNVISRQQIALVFLPAEIVLFRKGTGSTVFWRGERGGIFDIFS
jgi:hypothetical protein